jgi:hypothetical protein
MVRPGAVRLQPVDATDGSDTGQLIADVERSAFLGSLYEHVLRIDEERQLLVHSPAPAPGDRVAASFDEAFAYGPGAGS